MSIYSCDSCKMCIEIPKCGHCHKELIPKILDVKDKKVQVLECPEGCGRIKSPQCCEHDMCLKKNP